MQTADQAYRFVADLYWVAFLLTGCADRSADVVLNELDKNSIILPSTLPVLRKAVIRGALATMCDELISSAARMEVWPTEHLPLPPFNWSLDPNTSKSQVENALRAIEVFPRCALLLTVFEGFKLCDAAVLLNADPELVMRGRIVGL